MPGEGAGARLRRDEDAVQIGRQDHVLRGDLRRQPSQQRGFGAAFVLGSWIQPERGNPVWLRQAEDAVKARHRHGADQQASPPRHRTDAAEHREQPRRGAETKRHRAGHEAASEDAADAGRKHEDRHARNPQRGQQQITAKASPPDGDDDEDRGDQVRQHQETERVSDIERRADHPQGVGGGGPNPQQVTEVGQLQGGARDGKPDRAPVPARQRPAEQAGHGEQGELRIDQLQPEDGAQPTDEHASGVTVTQTKTSGHGPAHQRHRPWQMRGHADQVSHAASRRGHLGRVADERTKVDVVREQSADPTAQDAQRKRPAPHQSGAEQLGDQQPDRAQQGRAGRQPAEMIEPGTGRPANQVGRPQIPGIQHDAG